jgi:hypothetical protein
MEELGKGNYEARCSGTGWSVGKIMQALAVHNADQSRAR